MGFQGIPGHEFVGEVSAGPAELVGTRVVAEINFACGRCAVCAQGLGRHCAARRAMGILHADGSCAEYVGVPVAMHALEHQRVTVAPWLDRVYPLAEGLTALAHAARPGTLKILLRMF